MSIPLHIVKKSAKWYWNSLTGKYIHVNNLQTYIAEQAQLKLKI